MSARVKNFNEQQLTATALPDNQLITRETLSKARGDFRMIFSLLSFYSHFLFLLIVLFMRKSVSRRLSVALEIIYRAVADGGART